MSDEFADRLKQAIEIKGKKPRAVSLDAGMSADAVRGILRHPEASPTLATVTKLAQALGTSPEWLAFGGSDGPSQAHANRPLIASFSPDDPEDAEEYQSAPHKTDFPKDAIIELAPRGGLGAGEIAATALTREVHGVSEVDAIREDYWRFPQRFLNETLRRPASALIVIECEGDSMRPTLSPGERVWVDTSHRLPSPDGIYALRDRFENIVVKRLQLDETGPEAMLLILSDNASHQPMRRNLDEVNIVGRVVGGFRIL